PRIPIARGGYRHRSGHRVSDLREDRPMRLGSIDGRAVIVVGEQVVDLADASAGRLGPDLAGAYARWNDVLEVATGDLRPTGPLDPTRLERPVEPRQVFAIGLNYRDHAAETGKEVPEIPATFT